MRDVARHNKLRESGSVPKYGQSNHKIAVLAAVLPAVLDHDEWLEMAAKMALAGCKIQGGKPPARIDSFDKRETNALTTW